MVSHYLTQNIDDLESKAGFKPEECVQAHGANFGATCSFCKAKEPRDKMIKGIKDGNVYYCELEKDVDGKKEQCKGPVKPDIVFFGEGLPEKFIKLFENISNECDLMIVMGTGLAVSPFNQMVDSVKTECPKVLINLNNCDEAGYDFKSKFFPERLYLHGKCDDVVVKICKDCGWNDEFMGRIKESKNQPDPEKVDEILADMEQIDPKGEEDNQKEESSSGPTIEELKSSDKNPSSKAEEEPDASPKEAETDA